MSPFFVIFEVLDVSFTINLCLNCSFFYIYQSINDNHEVDIQTHVANTSKTDILSLYHATN